jgi:hypothetical protein
LNPYTHGRIEHELLYVSCYFCLDTPGMKCPLHCTPSTPRGALQVLTGDPEWIEPRVAIIWELSANKSLSAINYDQRHSRATTGGLWKQFIICVTQLHALRQNIYITPCTCTSLHQISIYESESVSTAFCLTAKWNITTDVCKKNKKKIIKNSDPSFHIDDPANNCASPSVCCVRQW